MKALVFSTLFAAGLALSASARADDSQPDALAFENFSDATKALKAATIEGTSYQTNGGASVLAETAQIAGQIVADRASQAAYQLLRDKVQAWLRCGKTGTPFVATCRTVAELRLQDLAMAPAVLQSALVADIVGLAVDKAPAPPAGAALGAKAVIERTIAAVVPLLAGSADVYTPRTADAMLRAYRQAGLGELHAQVKVHPIDTTIAAEGRTKEENPQCWPDGDPRDRVLALATYAVTTCELRGATNCPVGAIVSAYVARCPDAFTADQVTMAASIAGHMQDAVSLDGPPGSSGTSQPDGKARLRAVVEATFDLACLYASAASGPYVCTLDAASSGTITGPEAVAMLRSVVVAAMDRDGQALVTAVSAALARFPDRAPPAAAKALRVIATIAAYAASYTSAEGADEAHKQRTRLLESLTRDMTDRTDRGGDTIFSVGGSLRAVVGGRVGNRDDAGDRPREFWGPLSLPLGFALDVLHRDSRRGFHFELSIVDLGGYLSWKDGAQVAEPELSDALAPAVTAGYFWGRELPFYAGLTFGVSPGFDFTPDDGGDRAGAFNLGVTAGIYVPLLDLN